MKLQLSHPSIGTFGFSLPEDTTIVLGRDTSEADLELPWDARVSRRHAAVRNDGGVCRFRDLGSRNGSFCGPERIEEEVPLAPGTRILIGDTTLELAAPEASPWAEITETDAVASVTDELAALREAAEIHSSRRASRSRETSDLPSGHLPSARPRRPAPIDRAAPSRAPSGPPRRAPSRPAPSRPAPAQPAPAQPAPAQPAPAQPASAQPASAQPGPPRPEPSPRAAPAPTEETPSIRFTGPTRVRIEGQGLQALWRSDLAHGRLFVVGAAPVQRGSRVWIDVSLDGGLHELSAEVVHVGPGPGGATGVGLAISGLPAAFRAALEAGADETSVTTVEIEPPVELLEEAATAPPSSRPPRDEPEPAADRSADASSAPAERRAPGAPDRPAAAPAERRAPRRARSRAPVGREAGGDLAQRFVSLVAADRLYEAIECAPEATDEEVASRLALWNGRLADGASEDDMEGLLEPLARALAMVEAHFGTPQARLRYDFAHGFVHAERRRELAAEGRGPSLAVLQSSWRRAFPAKSERARRLLEAARRARQAGRAEEAEQLRAQARSLAPFA